MYICGKKISILGRFVRMASVDAEGYQFFDDPEAAIERFRSAGVRIDVVTFIQKLGHTVPKYRYPMEWENMAALRVSSFESWMKNQIDFRARNKIRKAEKNGVAVREIHLDEAFVRGVTHIYNECPIRQGRPFWHYSKGPEEVWKMMSAFLGRTIFLGAFYEEVLIGFVQLVTDECRGQAGLMQILSTIRHRDKAPTNALIAQAVRSCAERNIPYLWYANFSYGRKEQDSLAEFKRHNGFEKVEIPRYYVPLTLAGRAALRLGLQHGLADRIPESVASKYRKIRSLWYRKKFPSFEGA